MVLASSYGKISASTAASTFQSLEALMITTIVQDPRYSVRRKELNRGEGEMALAVGSSQKVTDQLVTLKSVCKIPVKVVRLRAGGLASIPASSYGQTEVNYVGTTPLASIEPDRFGNMQLLLPAGCAVEVTFNREVPGAHGRNRGAHGKKIIYWTEGE